MKFNQYIFALVVTLVWVGLLAIGYGYSIDLQDSKAEIKELKTELKQAKEKIKVLEKNQTIVYHADSWGGKK